MLGMALTFLILALIAGVFGFTTIAGAEAAVEGMKHMNHLDVISVQEMHVQLSA